MKNTLKIIGIILLVSILFRGWLYRNLITYTEVGTRPSIEITNPILLERIQSKSIKSTIDIEKISTISRSITIEELSFSQNQISRNPNELINTHQANCVGYTAMFNSIANHLINTNQLADKYEANHLVGRLEFLGFNLHQLFDRPFFRDHDFNEIIDQHTRTPVSLDLTIDDYLGIKYVCRKSYH